MKHITAKQLKATIKDLKAGEKIYINALGLTTEAIEVLKDFINIGVIVPVQEVLDKAIKKEFHADCITGVCVCPQMEYIKMKEVKKQCF